MPDDRDRSGQSKSFQKWLMCSTQKYPVCLSASLSFTFNTIVLHYNICKCGCGPLHYRVCSLCCSRLLPKHIWNYTSGMLSNSATASWFQGVGKGKTMRLKEHRGFVCFLLRCSDASVVKVLIRRYWVLMLHLTYLWSGKSELETWNYVMFDQVNCDEWCILSSSKQWAV